MMRGDASVAVVDLGEARRAGALMLAVAASRPLWSGATGFGGVPCPLRTLTGIPCPLCGMTTSVTAMMSGHPGAALAANPLGVVAVVVAVALLFLRRSSRLSVPLPAVVAALAASWAFEFWRFA